MEVLREGSKRLYSTSHNTHSAQPPPNPSNVFILGVPPSSVEKKVWLCVFEQLFTEYGVLNMKDCRYDWLSHNEVVCLVSPPILYDFSVPHNCKVAPVSITHTLYNIQISTNTRLTCRVCAMTTNGSTRPPFSHFGLFDVVHMYHMGYILVVHRLMIESTILIGLFVHNKKRSWSICQTCFRGV